MTKKVLLKGGEQLQNYLTKKQSYNKTVLYLKTLRAVLAFSQL